jgi:hypothetical protein
MSILISILMNVCFHVINLSYSKKKYNKKEADDNIKVKHKNCLQRKVLISFTKIF